MPVHATPAKVRPVLHDTTQSVQNLVRNVNAAVPSLKPGSILDKSLPVLKQRMSQVISSANSTFVKQRNSILKAIVHKPSMATI